MSSPKSITCTSKYLFDDLNLLSYPRNSFKKKMNNPNNNYLHIDLLYIHQEDILIQQEMNEMLCNYINSSEYHKIIQKFRLIHDQKLGLGSLLLQHHAIVHRFGCDKSQYEILRTSYGKPYTKSKYFDIGTWNYNVSHHGDYVGIVESNSGNIGLDIATLQPRKSWDKDSIDYINMFIAQFTPAEIKWQKSGHSEIERYRRFFVNWALKEAYIKAVGRGLQIDLLNLEFTIDIQEINEFRFQGNASLMILGNQTMNTDDWNFTFRSLDDNHVAAIALSPSCGLQNQLIQLNPKRISLESLLQSSPVYF